VISVLPRLTQSGVPLVREIDVVNEQGRPERISIPAERALTVYVDKRELVTLMTLGAYPEHLVLGYLRNQRLLSSVAEIESVAVDWEVGSAAVYTRSGIDQIEARTAQRVVTTGCGQGSVFGGLMDAVDQLVLPETCITQAQLYGIVNTIRLLPSVYKTAGSVHGCALFGGFSREGEHLLHFVEDVGRHNAIDTLAGWLWLQPQAGIPSDLVFYTTGRLTSEMLIKAAQMGVAIVISRSGITQMGHDIALQLGLCAIGRATNRRFLCFSGAARLAWQPE
jgi:FdhD protein